MRAFNRCGDLAVCATYRYLAEDPLFDASCLSEFLNNLCNTFN